MCRLAWGRDVLSVLMLFHTIDCLTAQLCVLNPGSRSQDCLLDRGGMGRGRRVRRLDRSSQGRPALVEPNSGQAPIPLILICSRSIDWYDAFHAVQSGATRQSSGQPAPSPQLACSKRARGGDMGQPVPPTVLRRSIDHRPPQNGALVDLPRPVKYLQTQEFDRFEGPGPYLCLEPIITNNACGHTQSSRISSSRHRKRTILFGAPPKYQDRALLLFCYELWRDTITQSFEHGGVQLVDLTKKQRPRSRGANELS